jgi:hypothetical protein
MDDVIAEAMALVDGSTPPPEAEGSQPAELQLEAHLDPPEPEEPEGVVTASRTLAQLEESRRPPPDIACGTCPRSVWFEKPTEVSCYCRVMYLITWTTAQPGEIRMCDGLFLR